MRPLNCTILSDPLAIQDKDGDPVGSGFLFEASFQIVSSGASTSGSIQIQASNDVPDAGTLGPFTPTIWANLGSPVSFTGANSYLIPKQDLSYQWIRAVSAITSVGVQDIATVDDVGFLFFETENFIPVDGPPDSGTLTLDFNGSPVVMQFNDTAGTFQTQLQLIAGYENALVTGDFSTSFHIDMQAFPDPPLGTITSNTLLNGVDPVGINITESPGSFSSTLNNAYFLIEDANGADKYAIVFDVSGQGVAPTVPGYTVTPVAIASQDTAATIAIALSAVLNGLAGISSTVLSPGLVEVTNDVGGPFVPAVDSASAPTGFTFSVTSSGSVSVNMKAMGD